MTRTILIPVQSKFEAVCEELRKIDADIVGLQELDRFSNRCGAQVDQLKELADELGYSYYFYTKRFLPAAENTGTEF